MVVTTDGDRNRQKTLKLIEEKENIEKKIEEYGQILKNVRFL